MGSRETPLEAARFALSRGDWAGAQQAFEVLAAERETAEALDGLGAARWWLGDIDGLRTTPPRTRVSSPASSSSSTRPARGRARRSHRPSSRSRRESRSTCSSGETQTAPPPRRPRSWSRAHRTPRAPATSPRSRKRSSSDPTSCRSGDSPRYRRRNAARNGPTGPGTSATLTKGEDQVLRLIALGTSNAEIGFLDSVRSPAPSAAGPGGALST